MNEPTVQGDLSEDTERLSELKEVDLGFEEDLSIGSPVKLEGSGFGTAKVMVGKDADGKLKLAQDLSMSGFGGPSDYELGLFAELGVTVNASYHGDTAELESFITKEDINIAIDNGKLVIVPSDVEEDWFEIRRP